MMLEASGPCAEILPPLGDIPSGGRPGEASFSTLAAASIVHDLGNLIQIASSAINIVARSPDMPAIHAGPMLDRAKNCLEQAGALVRQNLGRARDFAVAEQRSSIAACLSDVRTLVTAMDEPGLVLDLDIEPGLPDVRCDPIGLRRAVLNLLLNARDAMAAQGSVLIRTRRIFPADGGGAAVELQVVDHGRGMSPATIARVFDPFFTTKSDGLGGIGLPMVERFVRDAGGNVTIASEPGAGTIVTLRLPATARIQSLAEESHR